MASSLFIDLCEDKLQTQYTDVSCRSMHACAETWLRAMHGALSASACACSLTIILQKSFIQGSLRRKLKDADNQIHVAGHVNIGDFGRCPLASSFSKNMHALKGFMHACMQKENVELSLRVEMHGKRVFPGGFLLLHRNKVSVGKCNFRRPEHSFSSCMHACILYIYIYICIYIYIYIYYSTIIIRIKHLHACMEMNAPKMPATTSSFPSRDEAMALLSTLHFKHKLP